MKTIYQLALILTFNILTLNVNAQNEKSISISGNYSLLPLTKMKGIGYALAYQHSINNSYFVKAKYAYAQAWREIPAPTVEDKNYELFPTHYNYAGFHFSAQAGYQQKFLKSFSLHFSIGPSLSYQSTLKERTNYHYIELSYAKTTINEDFQEGLFWGGTCDLNLEYIINNNWSVIAEGSIAGYLKAQTVVNTGLGIQYSF